MFDQVLNALHIVHSLTVFVAALSVPDRSVQCLTDSRLVHFSLSLFALYLNSEPLLFVDCSSCCYTVFFFFITSAFAQNFTSKIGKSAYFCYRLHRMSFYPSFSTYLCSFVFDVSFWSS